MDGVENGAGSVAQAAPKLSDPHPHWSVENKNEDYPKSVDEWDPRKDPVGQHLALAEKRLRVAMDRDDPRAPDEMALISRWDLTTLVHDWWHKCAVFDLWLAERNAKEASLVSSTVPATPAPQEDGRAGWKLVPVEPTQEMVRAAYQEQPGSINAGFAQAYRSMISAVPAALSAPPSVALEAAHWKERHDAVLQAHMECCGLPPKLTGELACILEDCGPPEMQSPEALAELTRHYQPTWDRIVAALTRPQPGGAVAGTHQPTNRNWIEDAAHENGNYECRCVECDHTFIGHKRRVLCKLCSNLLKVAGTERGGPDA